MMNHLVFEKTNEGYWSVARYVPEQKKVLAFLIQCRDLPYELIRMQQDFDQVTMLIAWDLEDYFLFKNVPKLHLSLQNHYAINQVLAGNKLDQKHYIIFFQDEKGWIHCEAKDELSVDDLAAIAEDRKAAEAWRESWIRKAYETKFQRCKRTWPMMFKRYLIKKYRKICAFFN